MTKHKFIHKAAKRLVVGDRLLSKTGKIFVVTLVVQKMHRTIVLFDGDMEIDFESYHQLQVMDD